MRLLAFDCATAAVSAAVFDGGAAVAAERLSMARGQAEALLPLIARVLGDTKVEALDALATTVGPGSYTGLRVGLAAAAGLAAATKLPVIGVTTLEAVAAAAREAMPGAPILVALESQREDLFVQSFEADGTPLTEPRALSPHEAVSLYRPGAILAGDGAARLRAALGRDANICAEALTPDALWVGKLALARIAADPECLTRSTLPTPLYLRAPLTTPLAAP